MRTSSFAQEELAITKLDGETKDGPNGVSQINPLFRCGTVNPLHRRMYIN